MGLYIIEEIVSTNTVKLKLLTTMRIHLVVNVSQIVRYREPVVGQRVIILKLAEADREKKQKVEKILNKQKSKRSNQVLSTVEGVHSRT